MASKEINIEIKKLQDFDKTYNDTFNNHDYMEYDEVYSKVMNLIPPKLDFKIQFIFSYFQYKDYEKLYNDEINKYSNTKYYVDYHNNAVIAFEIQNFNTRCGKVEDKELDNQQIDAIVRKNRNQLVIASAGSGKTTTIVGKVKYLLITQQVKPEDILLLSFTKASATEMSERIKKETGVSLDVCTFHKLGLEIIKKSTGQNVIVYDKGLYAFVKDTLNENIKNPTYFEKLIYFMATARYGTKDEFDFKTEKEYQDYLLNNKPTTLKGEKVKSYGELEIANYLFSNNINYIYEKKYEFDTMTSDYQQYTPDFYLPDYKIYIEYFGIDENGEVAPYFKSQNEKTPSENYNDSIKWKRKVHKQKNTKLIETYYYENKNHTLIKNLEEKLKRNHVKIEPKSKEELWKSIAENNAGIQGEICRAFEAIINLTKSNNYTLEYLYSLEEVQKSHLNKLTLDLIEPIFNTYQRMLTENQMIDFNDMINTATTFVMKSNYVHNYKYVIVDEYQDISMSRYKLLWALRNQKDYKLFCVGDDWQSIYRFNGSDINLITRFETYWGSTYISFIERTYRFTSMMSSLSGNFIMKNPNQYKKKIEAKASDDFAISFINGYTEEKCIDFLGEKLYRLEKNSTIYFLGRYSFDIDIFKNRNDYALKFNPAKNVTEVTYYKRRDLKIRFITVHKSKGLQADYVVILNNKNYGMGFPSKMEDLPLVHLLLSGGLDDYEYSEERRLFYVALTRSRKKAILLTIDNNKSCFVKELEDDYKEFMKNNEIVKRRIYTCPECGGRLIYKKGKYGPFLGCSNYPKCKYIKMN